MIKTSHLYYHPHLKHTVHVTEQQANWVEFYEIHHSEPELRWLEHQVFESAYDYDKDGDPVTLDLPKLRQQAQEKGILVPYEFA